MIHLLGEWSPHHYSLHPWRTCRLGSHGPTPTPLQRLYHTFLQCGHTLPWLSSSPRPGSNFQGQPTLGFPSKRGYRTKTKTAAPTIHWAEVMMQWWQGWTIWSWLLWLQGQTIWSWLNSEFLTMTHPSWSCPTTHNPDRQPSWCILPCGWTCSPSSTR